MIFVKAWYQYRVPFIEMKTEQKYRRRQVMVLLWCREFGEIIVLWQNNRFSNNSKYRCTHHSLVNLSFSQSAPFPVSLIISLNNYLTEHSFHIISRNLSQFYFFKNIFLKFIRHIELHYKDVSYRIKCNRFYICYVVKLLIKVNVYKFSRLVYIVDA